MIICANATTILGHFRHAGISTGTKNDPVLCLARHLTGCETLKGQASRPEQWPVNAYSVTCAAKRTPDALGVARRILLHNDAHARNWKKVRGMFEREQSTQDCSKGCNKCLCLIQEVLAPA